MLLTQGDLETASLHESLCSKPQELSGSPELLLLLGQDTISQWTGRYHASVRSSGFYRVEINDNLVSCEAACSVVAVWTLQELGAAPARSHPDKLMHQYWLEGRMVRFLSERGGRKTGSHPIAKGKEVRKNLMVARTEQRLWEITYGATSCPIYLPGLYFWEWRQGNAGGDLHWEFSHWSVSDCSWQKYQTFECWMGLGGIYQDVGHHHSCPPVEDRHAPDWQVCLSCGRDLERKKGLSQISLEGKNVGMTGNNLVLCRIYVEGTKMPIVHSMEPGDWTYLADAALSIVLKVFFWNRTILQSFCGEKGHFVLILRKSNCVGLPCIVCPCCFCLCDRECSSSCYLIVLMVEKERKDPDRNKLKFSFRDCVFILYVVNTCILWCLSFICRRFCYHPSIFHCNKTSPD